MDSIGSSLVEADEAASLYFFKSGSVFTKRFFVFSLYLMNLSSKPESRKTFPAQCNDCQQGAVYSSEAPEWCAIMLCVVMLSVIMLSVIILSVVALG